MLIVIILHYCCVLTTNFSVETRIFMGFFVLQGYRHCGRTNVVNEVIR